MKTLETVQDFIIKPVLPPSETLLHPLSVNQWLFLRPQTHRRTEKVKVIQRHTAESKQIHHQENIKLHSASQIRQRTLFSTVWTSNPNKPESRLNQYFIHHQSDSPINQENTTSGPLQEKIPKSISCNLFFKFHFLLLTHLFVTFLLISDQRKWPRLKSNQLQCAVTTCVTHNSIQHVMLRLYWKHLYLNF